MKKKKWMKEYMQREVTLVTEESDNGSRQKQKAEKQIIKINE